MRREVYINGTRYDREQLVIEYNLQEPSRAAFTITVDHTISRYGVAQYDEDEYTDVGPPFAFLDLVRIESETHYRPLFYGHINRIERERMGQRTTRYRITCMDLMQHLHSRVYPSPTSYSGDSDKEVIEDLIPSGSGVGTELRHWLLENPDLIESFVNPLPDMELNAITLHEVLTRLCEQSGASMQVTARRHFAYFDSLTFKEAPFELSDRPDTNLLQRSEEFVNPWYYATALNPITLGVDDGPNGETGGASQVDFNIVAAGFSGVLQDVLVPPGQEITFSIYARVAAGTRDFRLGIQDMEPLPNLIADKHFLGGNFWGGTATETPNVGTPPLGETASTRIDFTAAQSLQTNVWPRKHPVITGRRYVFGVWLQLISGTDVRLRIRNTSSFGGSATGTDATAIASPSSSWTFFSVSKVMESDFVDLRLENPSGVSSVSVHASGAYFMEGSSFALQFQSEKIGGSLPDPVSETVSDDFEASTSWERFSVTHKSKGPFVRVHIREDVGASTGSLLIANAQLERGREAGVYQKRIDRVPAFPLGSVDDSTEQAGVGRSEEEFMAPANDVYVAGALTNFSTFGVLGNHDNTGDYFEHPRADIIVDRSLTTEEAADLRARQIVSLRNRPSRGFSATTEQDGLEPGMIVKVSSVLRGLYRTPLVVQRVESNEGGGYDTLVHHVELGDYFRDQQAIIKQLSRVVQQDRIKA